MASKKSAASKVNKSAFVRSTGDLPAAQVVADAKKKGIKLTENYVYTIRSAAKRKKTQGRPLKNPTRSTNGVSKNTTSEAQLVDLVLDMGLNNAQRVIDKLRAAVKNA